MRAIDSISEKGYVILENQLTDSQITEFLKTCKFEFKNSNLDEKGIPFLNQNTPVVYNLQNKNIEIVKYLLNNKEIEAILIYFLNDKFYKQIAQDQPNYILRAIGARSSNIELPLHIDSFIPFIGDELIAMQVSIVLEDQTVDKGCTILLPGSHKYGEYAEQNSRNKCISITPKKGDIVIWDSRIWHGAHANKTNSTRWAIIATFCRWWVKQQFDIPNNIPNDFKQFLTDKELSVLGACSIPPSDELESIDMKKGYGHKEK